jgi:hypothetical protein
VNKFPNLRITLAPSLHTFSSYTPSLHQPYLMFSSHCNIWCIYIFLSAKFSAYITFPSFELAFSLKTLCLCCFYFDHLWLTASFLNDTIKVKSIQTEDVTKFCSSLKTPVSHNLVLVKPLYWGWLLYKTSTSEYYFKLNLAEFCSYMGQQQIFIFVCGLLLENCWSTNCCSCGVITLR